MSKDKKQKNNKKHLRSPARSFFMLEYENQENIDKHLRYAVELILPLKEYRERNAYLEQRLNTLLFSLTSPISPNSFFNKKVLFNVHSRFYYEPFVPERDKYPKIHIFSNSLLNKVDAFNAAIKSVEAFIPEAQREYYQHNIIPEIERLHKGSLTISDVIAIISMLLSIFMTIIQLLPDEQLDRLIAQNEIIMAQNQTMITQNDQKIDAIHEQNRLLRDIANAIEDVQVSSTPPTGEAIEDQAKSEIEN